MAGLFVQCMKFLLTKRFGFREDEILLLTETNPNPVMHPTKANIFRVGEALEHTFQCTV
jgi:hypothetical protein